MRIVSLLPSATEILFALGLGDEVVGVTFECDFPPEARTKRIVSTSALPAGLSPAEIDVVVKERMAAGEDLYRLDRGAFADLDPTLVVTQDLCAVCAVDVTEVDDALAYLGCRAEVLTLDPMTLDEVLDSVLDGRRGDGHVRPRRGDRRRVPGAAGRGRRRRRRCAAPAGARARVDRSRVHRRPLGARPGDGGRRRGAARKTGREVGRRGLDDGGRLWCRGRDRGAVRVPARRQPPRSPSRPSPPACCRTDAEVWAVDADAFVVRPGPRVVDGVETFASILHPDRCGHPAGTAARRVA